MAYDGYEREIGEVQRGLTRGPEMLGVAAEHLVARDRLIFHALERPPSRRGPLNT